MATLSFNLDGNRLVLEFDRLCSYASATLNGEPIDIARAEAMADEWRVRARRTRLGRGLPLSGETQPPLDRRVITAAEAHRELGIPSATIRSWANRHRLFAVSIGRDGQRWYRLADILTLRHGV